MKKRVVVEDSDDDDGEDLFGDHEERAQAKKKAKSSIEHEYTCPITRELFIDPVTAEDGRVYERASIVRMFNDSPETTVMTARSPLTNAPMGKQLLPAHQVKAALEALIGAEVINGERVETWKETMLQRDKDRKKVRDLTRRSDNGDAHAAMQLGIAHDKGLYGLAKDPSIAYKLHKKASMGGVASAATRVAILLLKGRGVEMDEERAMQYMLAGALQGSEHACEHMGNSYWAGVNGCPQDDDEALLWYEKMRTCEHKDSVDFSRKRAAQFFREREAAQEARERLGEH